MSLRVATVLVVLIAGAGAAHATETACTTEVGVVNAQTLVNQCTDISPATHPPCNADNPCEMIIAEIRRGCDFARNEPKGDVPDYCEQYPANEQPAGY